MYMYVNLGWVVHTHINMNRVGNRSMFSLVVIALNVVHCNTYVVYILLHIYIIFIRPDAFEIIFKHKKFNTLEQMKYYNA